MQPLDLTVHNPPSVHSLAQGAQAPALQRSGRWKMLLVLLVCAAPVVASYFTYYVIRPEARRSFGELIEPQRAMPANLIAKNLAGDAVPLHSLKGQWLLISTSTAACGALCEQQLYLQRQLREALGREKERLDWVWFINDGQASAPALQPALASAQVLHLPQSDLQTWLQPAPGQQLQDHLYVIDPQGHWMLRFPASLNAANANQAKRDLERLLRASSSWDQPGR